VEYATWRMIQDLSAAIRNGRLSDMGYIPCAQCRELIRPDGILCPYCSSLDLIQFDEQVGFVDHAA
jgi:hypothetical protein